MTAQETLANPPNVFVQVEAPKHRMGWKGKLACILTAAAVVIGTYNAIDDHFGWPHLPGIDDIIPDINIHGQTTPPVAEAQVLPDYETEAEISAFCTGRVGVRTAVEAHTHQIAASGNYDQIIKGDLLLCGDTGVDEDRAVLVRDGKTGAVKSVMVETDGLQVTQPRIDFTDKENCVDLRVKDSEEKIRQKIAEWEKKNAKGQAECDERDGFSVSGIIGTDRLGGVIPMAYKAAQIAMALGAEPRQQIEEQNPRYVAQLQRLLEQKYPGVPVKVTLTSSLQQRQARMDKVVDDLRSNSYTVTVTPDDKHPETSIISVKAPGDSEAKVRVRSVDVAGVNVQSITQGEERVLPTTTTTTQPLAPSTTVQRRAA